MMLKQMGIARREARESWHWLKLINAADLSKQEDKEELNWLIKEAKELMLILSSIIKTHKKTAIKVLYTFDIWILTFVIL